MSLDPRHLSQLATIVSLGSFTEAADQLGLAQSALSRNMKTLEEQVGAPVLVRGRRGAVATDLGNTLAQYGDIIGKAQGQAVSATRSITSIKANYLRIASTRLIAENFLVGPLAAFTEARPDITSQLQIGLIDELSEMVALGKTDLAIGNFAALHNVGGLHVEPLFGDMMTVIARPGHPLVGADGTPAKILADARWVVPWPGARFRWEIDIAIRNLGINLMDVAFESVSVAAMLAVVQRTDFVTMLPWFGIAPLLKNREFVELFPPQSDQSRSIGILTQEVKRHSPVLNGFIQLLREAARDVADQEVDSRAERQISAA